MNNHMGRRAFLKMSAMAAGAAVVVTVARPIAAQIVSDQDAKPSYRVEQIERVGKQPNTYYIRFTVDSPTLGRYRQDLDITIPPHVRTIKTDERGWLSTDDGKVFVDPLTLVDDDNPQPRRWDYDFSPSDAKARIYRAIERAITRNETAQRRGTIDGSKHGNGTHLFDSKQVRVLP